MPDGAITGMPVEMGRQLFGGKREMGIGQEFLHATISPFQLFDDSVNLHTVTG